MPIALTLGQLGIFRIGADRSNRDITALKIAIFVPSKIGLLFVRQLSTLPFTGEKRISCHVLEECIFERGQELM